MSFVVNSSGVYFVFEDMGVCVVFMFVLILYMYCLSILYNGVVFNMVVVFFFDQQNIIVSGKCFEKVFLYFINSIFFLMCFNFGKWVMDDKVICKCSVGYEFVGNICIGEINV